MVEIDRMVVDACKEYIEVRDRLMMEYGTSQGDGKFSTIRIQWNDAKRTLTLDARKGTFPGSLNQRTFDVQLLNGQKQTISYLGKKVTVKL